MSIKTVLKLDRLRKESEANYLEFLETYGFLQEEYMIAEIQILEAQEVPSSIIAKKRLQLKQLRKDMKASENRSKTNPKIESLYQELALIIHPELQPKNFMEHPELYHDIYVAYLQNNQEKLEHIKETIPITPNKINERINLEAIEQEIKYIENTPPYIFKIYIEQMYTLGAKLMGKTARKLVERDEVLEQVRYNKSKRRIN